MKESFHSRLIEFRDALNAEAKLCCNVDNAYDLDKAADFLQQLSKSWKMSEDDVITITTQRVGDMVDKQLRMYVLRFLDMMKIPHSEERIKERWGTLSTEEKDEVVDGVIDYMQRNKRSD